MSQDALRAEQQDIENQIRKDMDDEQANERRQEHAEVAEAVLESNPDDFSQEQDMSQHAMQAAVNSQAALS